MINGKAIFVGVTLSFLTYFIIMSVGIVLGGGAVRNLFEPGATGVFAWSSAAVAILSIVAGLFVGSFICTRATGGVGKAMNVIQSCVVATLFFVGLSLPLGRTIGVFGSGLQAATGGVGAAMSDFTTNDRLQDVIGQTLSDLTFRGTSIDVVVRGLATRLANGDFVGAKNYLARQAGINPADADRRIERFRFEIETTLRELSMTAGRAISLAGWAFFACLSLGTLSAALGGMVGSERNRRRPIAGISAGDYTVRRAA